MRIDLEIKLSTTIFHCFTPADGSCDRTQDSRAVADSRRCFLVKLFSKKLVAQIPPPSVALNAPK